MFEVHFADMCGWNFLPMGVRVEFHACIHTGGMTPISNTKNFNIFYNTFSQHSLALTLYQVQPLPLPDMRNIAKTKRMETPGPNIRSRTGMGFVIFFMFTSCDQIQNVIIIISLISIIYKVVYFIIILVQDTLAGGTQE